METRTIYIMGAPYEIPLPYSAGPSSINEAEAGVLNAVFCDNIKNNLSAKYKDFPNELTEPVVAEYAGSYNFGQKAGGRIVDPVRREALRLAVDQVKMAIKHNPELKLSDYKISDLNELGERLLLQNSAIFDVARENVKRAQAVAKSTLSELLGE